MIAESFPRGRRQEPGLRARVPAGPLFGNPVGYIFIEVGRVGIERSENDLLAGERNEFATRSSTSSGDVPQEGDDVTLTIDAEAQRVATPGAQSAIAVDGRSERSAAPWSRSSPTRGRSR